MKIKSRKDQIVVGFVGTLISGIVCGIILLLFEYFIISPRENTSKSSEKIIIIPGDTGMSSEKRKYSCIQAVDGYAHLSESMNIEQAKTAAFADARKKAIEMSRRYITNGKIKEYNLIWPDSESAVSILDQKDYGLEADNSYHIWIMAEVEYRVELKNQDAMLQDLSGPLTVNVWTSKKKYKDGENIEIMIRGNKDFHARIADISSTGEIIQILPNLYRNINFFKAGKIYRIPDTGDQFYLKAAFPFGEDKIVVYASEVPLGRVNTKSSGQGMGIINGNEKSLAIRSRGISITPKASDTLPGTEFYEAFCFFTTEK